MSPANAISEAYNGQLNWMTPTVLKYGWIVEDQIAYEISSGRGIEHDTIWGVSVVIRNAEGRWERAHGPTSTCCHSKGAALRHVADLTHRPPFPVGTGE